MSDKLVSHLRQISDAMKSSPMRGVDFVGQAADRIEKLESLFPAILEYLEEQADVVDGDSGIPAPNRAMSLLVWTKHGLEKK